MGNFCNGQRQKGIVPSMPQEVLQICEEAEEQCWGSPQEL